MSKKVAIAGVTGVVGQEMLGVLERREFPLDELRVFASERSVGRKVSFRGEELTVELLTPSALKGMDIALYSAGSSVSKATVSEVVKNGTIMVDNSSAFRMDPEVPLVIPEINPEDVKNHKGVIANPNCSTIIMLVPVWPIHKINPIKRIVVSTYQAVSGAGAKAMQELSTQTKDFLAGGEITPEAFSHRIAFNLFSHDSAIGENGYCEEEMKMVKETWKIFHDNSIGICPTTIRVPVLRAHSESIRLELDAPMSREDALDALDGAPGIRIVDDWKGNHFPMPFEASGQDEILVGRVREDLSCDHGLVMWVCGDQLLKGAALNAVQIAELLL